MKAYATYNITDDKLRAEFSERLEEEDYRKVKAAGFAWWPKQEVFAAKWSPAREDLLMEMGVEEIPVIEEEDDAEARSERFETYSENASSRSNEAYQRSHEIASRIPFGQPILVGHYSERKARADYNRIHRAMDTSVAEIRKAEYWRERARAAVKHAQYKQKPGVIKRRIDKLEAEQRSAQRGVEEATRKGGKYSEHYQRCVDHLDMVLAYQRELYDASGGIPSEGMEIEKGDMVLSWAGWREVVRVNKKSVTIQTQYSWTQTIPYDKIRAHRKPATKIASEQI